MSERELRRYVLADSYNHIIGNMPNDALSLLDDDPDVVKVLRYLDARRHWGDRVEEEGNRAKDKNVEIAGMLTATECRFITDWLAFTFHVRLTDDGGWEWTDGGEGEEHTF